MPTGLLLYITMSTAIFSCCYGNCFIIATISITTQVIHARTIATSITSVPTMKNFFDYADYLKSWWPVSLQLARPCLRHGQQAARLPGQTWPREGLGFRL